MEFAIEEVTTKRDPFGAYKYLIYRDGKLVSRYWHNHRGDEHGIEIFGCDEELTLAGSMVDFIEGGGPKPLKLSIKAIAYLNSKLSAG